MPNNNTKTVISSKSKQLPKKSIKPPTSLGNSFS